MHKKAPSLQELHIDFFSICTAQLGAGNKAGSMDRPSTLQRPRCWRSHSYTLLHSCITFMKTWNVHIPVSRMGPWVTWKKSATMWRTNETIRRTVYMKGARAGSGTRKFMEHMIACVYICKGNVIVAMQKRNDFQRQRGWVNWERSNNSANSPLSWRKRWAGGVEKWSPGWSVSIFYDWLLTPYHRDLFTGREDGLIGNYCQVHPVAPLCHSNTRKFGSH